MKHLRTIVYYKTYYKIPFGEVQVGKEVHTVTIWFMNHRWRLWRGKDK